jgi:hypothetical protein
MTWKRISLGDLTEVLSDDLAKCSGEQREFFRRARIEPEKWRLFPLGDAGGGF